jgi:hypothetical protein
MASPKSTTAAATVTVEHVKNSLFQIESWIGAVRVALAGLDSTMPLRMPRVGMDPLAAAIKVQKDCPPPTHRRRHHKKKTSKKKK